jgi:hypothetical protein
MADKSLDGKQEPLDSPSLPMDHEPDAIATPEGDNEAAPDAPLTPSAPPIERPRGDEPHPEQPIRKA